MPSHVADSSGLAHAAAAPAPGVGPAHVNGSMLVGLSQSMAQLRRSITAVAPRECTVLVNGPSGAGKELVARSLHTQSRRASGPFVAVDCTGLRDTLLESQLFGHVRGAFTGAEQATLGFIRAADGGSLFLDEIGELDLKTQAKLLRCIQERCVVPLGSVKPVPVNVRFLAATHRDLKAMVARGEFREDLYFRLDVVKIQVPPLRERRDDVPILAEHFLFRLAELYGEGMKTLSDQSKAALRAYDWPGNVRELGNAMEHAVVFSTGPEINPVDLPERVRAAFVSADAATPRRAGSSAGAAASSAGGRMVSDSAAGSGATDAEGQPLCSLEEAERLLIARALKATRGNQSQAAIILCVDRRRLARKIDRYGLREIC